MKNTLEIEHVIKGDDSKYCLTGVLEDLITTHSVFYTAKSVLPDEIYMTFIAGVPPRYILQEKIPDCDFSRGESGEIVLGNEDMARFRREIDGGVQVSESGEVIISEVGGPDFYFYANNTIYYCYSHYKWLLKYQKAGAVPDFYFDDPEVLHDFYKEKNILMQEYVYKLIKFEEENEAVEFPADKKEISLAQVSKQLANYDNWEVLEYICSDKDRFYEWNAGNAGGIYMYHQGKLFEEWTLWLT